MTVRRPASGFSLIEILVAFTIAAISLAVIFRIYASGTTSTVLAEEYTTAVAIAESRLAELSTHAGLTIATQSGHSGSYQWDVRIEDHQAMDEPDFELPLSLKAIHVEVSWQHRGKTYQVSLNSLKPFFMEGQ